MELIKPEFDGELKADIQGIKTVEHNINIAKEYAIAYKEYVQNLVFTENDIKDAEGERAKINNMAKKLAQYRKDIITEYKKPIEEFETVAKSAESLFKEASVLVDTQIKNFEDKKWLEKQELIKKLVPETPEGFTLVWNEKWKNKGAKLEDISAEIQQQINVYVDDLNQMNKDIDIIKRMTNNEVYVERYKYCRDLSKILDDIDKDKKISESVEKEFKPEPITGEVLTKIYTVTFTGSLAQIEALKKYATEVLWMKGV